VRELVVAQLVRDTLPGVVSGDEIVILDKVVEEVGEAGAVGGLDAVLLQPVEKLLLVLSTILQGGRDHRDDLQLVGRGGNEEGAGISTGDDPERKSGLVAALQTSRTRANATAR